MNNDIKFSIILATYNRSEYIYDCINSIINQSYKNYEIIIIDQSVSDETKNIVLNIKDNCSDIDIKYNKVDIKGLSRSRNIGIYQSTGDYICLMDDDAEYERDFLFRAYGKIKDKDLDVVCGKIIDKNTKKSFLVSMDNSSEEVITKQNFMDLCCSASLVISKKLAYKLDGFDEDFGVGAKYGAAEESDLLFRLLYNNAKIMYFPDLVVYHPYPEKKFDQNSLNKTYGYGIGFGAFCRKNFKKDPLYFFNLFLISIIRPIGGILINLIRDKNKSKESIQRLKGRLKGCISYK